MQEKVKILLSTAGGGNANDLIRSLTKGKRGYSFVGTNINKFEIARSLAPKTYLVSRPIDNTFITQIEKIMTDEGIDFFIPNHELEIRKIQQSKSRIIDDKTFLPDLRTVETCIDKYLLIKKLEQNGIPVAKTIKIDPRSDIKRQVKQIQSKPGEKIWIRLKQGAGSRGAAPFYNCEQIMLWIDYWCKYKQADAESFIVSEFLPGRDYGYVSVWENGELIVAKVMETLAYTCGRHTLGGTSSSASIARMVINPDVIKICAKAVKSLSRNATGLFSVDVKENKKGIPCITEVNIGRFPRSNYIFNLAGKINMAEVYVELGLREYKGPRGVVDDFADVRLLIDSEPILMTADEMEKKCDKSVMNL